MDTNFFTYKKLHSNEWGYVLVCTDLQLVVYTYNRDIEMVNISIQKTSTRTNNAVRIICVYLGVIFSACSLTS